MQEEHWCEKERRNGDPIEARALKCAMQSIKPLIWNLKKYLPSDLFFQKLREKKEDQLSTEGSKV